MCDVKLSVPARSLMKAFRCYVLILCIKGCHLFRSFMCDATHQKSFSSGLSAFNEVHRRIFNILNDIFDVMWQDKEINQDMEMNHNTETNHYMEINHNMEGLVWNPEEILVKNQDKKKRIWKTMIRKINITHSILYIHRYKKIIISLSILNIRLRTSLEAVNPKPNDLWWVASHMKFLNNCQPFIHKINTWVYIKYFM